MKTKITILTVFIVLLFSCNNETKKAASQNGELNKEQTIYFGGDIITMEGDNANYVEAVVRDKDKIVFVGIKSEAEKKYTNAKKVDLKGKTLIPGFIDAHSHLWQTATKLGTVALDAPPASDIRTIDDIIIKMSNKIKSNPNDYKTEKDWLIGWGLDNGALKENRFPTRKDLDKISTKIPIVIVHFSSHMLMMNTLGMKSAGYFEKDYKSPEGGSLQYYEGTKEPNGVIEEQAMLSAFSKIGGDIIGKEGVYTGIQFKKNKMKKLVLEAQEVYLKHGYTTISDFAGTDESYNTIKELGTEGNLKADVGMAYYSVLTTIDNVKSLYSKEYTNHFRVIGGKLNLDGGSPGRTAYLREPYYTPTPGQPANYRGYSSITKQEDMNKLVGSYYKEKIPFYIHALGDAAVDQCIAAVQFSEKNYKYDDIRTNLIHLQQVQPDQFDALENLDVTLTYQITHNYYFADFHNKYIYGPERTARLNPMRDGLNKGLSTTFHHDSPVHPVNQIFLMWIAVNRESRSGKTFGLDQKLTPYEALYASTNAAAYQFFEENKKGTITKGKLADFVILSENPLKVNPENIKNITVLETIKEGKTVFKK